MDGHPDSKYTMGKKLGEGNFGEVFEAAHLQTGYTHAIKTVAKDKIQASELWAEIGIWKQFDHPHIMRLYGTFEDENNMYMASELCNGGELFDLIQKAGHLPETACKHLFKQALGAVCYLHAKKICHRDLKPENFMAARKADQYETIQLKMLDFGTAKCFANAPLYTKVCTLHYVAPEILKAKINEYTEKVDVWSCGVVLYMMIGGWLPFHHAKDIELMKLVKKGKYELMPTHVWADVSRDAMDLVRSMMCLKVADRFSADQAYQHDWFQRDEEGAGETSTKSKLDGSELLRCIMGYQMKSKLKQVALQIICRHLQDETIQRLRDMWLSLDTENLGRVSADRMEEELRKLNTPLDVIANMRLVLKAMENAGEIEYTEFLAATVTPQQYLKEDVCQAAFSTLDVDEDGILSDSDLNVILGVDASDGSRSLPVTKIKSTASIRKTVSIRGGSVSGGEFAEMVKGISKTGCLNFQEFMALMSEDETRGVTATRRREDRQQFSRKSIYSSNEIRRLTVMKLGSIGSFGAVPSLASEISESENEDGYD
jgi:calcium-dependent protein kinase